jgi:regulatory protein YycH of two-component signal transduction system YycFG
MRKAIIKNRITGYEVQCTSTTEHSMSSYGKPVWVSDKDGEVLLNDTDKPWLADPQFEIIKTWEE